MKKVFFILFTGILFLLACSTSNLSDGTKLYRIMIGDKISHEFNYNEKGLISNQIIYGIPDKKMLEINYHYDSKDRLIKTDSYTDVSSSTISQQLVYGYTDFIYRADGTLIEEIAYTKKGNQYEFASKTLLSYNAAGRTLSRLQVSIDNQPFNLYKYEYNAAGNIIIMESYQYDGPTPKLGFRSVYEHDNKKNPYIDLSVIPFSVNSNNIVKATVTNYNITPGFPVVTTTHTVYKNYNSSQLPVEVVEYGTTFTYLYK
ncbi:MAG: hypothetical protein H7122_01045 [Chitinophagaceae bacterium]|nr:hypothetical protein [Chitinophagaceae bacterium]